MNVYKIVVCWCLLFFAVAVGHAQIETNAGASNPYVTYSASRFSIDHPQDWEVDTSGTMGAKLIVFSGMEGPLDRFRENVNYLKQDLTGYHLDLKTFVELSAQQIEQFITEPSILSNQTITNDTLGTYQEVIYTGKQGTFDLKFLQYIWVENDEARILTFTAEQAQYADYEDIAYAILNSFRLKD